jgi:hypothetical protein
MATATRASKKRPYNAAPFINPQIKGKVFGEEGF